MTPADPAGVVRLVENSLPQRTDDGNLAPRAIEALDIVYHALVYTGEPAGLESWRAALWEGTLTPAARSSVASMVTRLNDSIREGDVDAVGEVCNCLETLFADPSGHPAAAERR